MHSKISVSLRARYDKFESHFWTGSAVAFQAAPRIRSLNVELRVLAAQLRLNFLHSQLFRWVYRELKFTMRGGVEDLRLVARSIG